MTISATETGVGTRGGIKLRLPTLTREGLNILLLTPAALLVLGLIAWPIVITFELSLHEIRLFDILRGRTGDPTILNYVSILSNGAFYATLGRTLYYVLAATLVAYVWGLATAIVLNQSFRGRSAVRLAVVSPWVIPPAIGSLIWMFLFDGHLGLANYVLLSVGLFDRPVAFLVHRDWAMWTVILASVWKSYPFFTIMLIAGLQAIPKPLYEAAQLDGASRWQQFRFITMPGLRNVAAIAIFLSLLASFREVETILVMTGGGPARATETLPVLIYNETFQAYRAGSGAALGVIGFLLSFAMMIFGFRRMMRSFF